MKKPLQLIQCMDSLETKWLNMKDFIVKPTQLEELLLQITALAPHNSKKKKTCLANPEVVYYPVPQMKVNICHFLLKIHDC